MRFATIAVEKYAASLGLALALRFATITSLLSTIALAIPSSVAGAPKNVSSTKLGPIRSMSNFLFAVVTRAIRALR